MTRRIASRHSTGSGRSSTARGPLLAIVLALQALHAAAQPGPAPAATGDADPAVNATLRSAPGLLERAQRGSVAAASALASAYYTGRDRERDLDAAIRWWRKAAAGGDNDAAYNAGLLMRAPEQQQEALTLLHQAASSGRVLAAFVLGTRLVTAGQTGRGEPHLERAARAGYAPAQFNLAQLKREAGDPASARAWLEQAAPTFAAAAEALAALPAPEEQPMPTEPQEAKGGPTVHDLDWVLTRPGGQYTIQVSAGRDSGALAQLLERHAGDHHAAWFEHRPDSREPYSAIVGVFDDYAHAETALASLPPALKNNNPWIRRFQTLQRELRVNESAPAATVPAPAR